MAITIGIIEALQSLVPGAEWVLNDTTLTWMDDDKTEPSTC